MARVLAQSGTYLRFSDRRFCSVAMPRLWLRRFSIQIGFQETLPKNSFIRIRGLPPTVGL